MKSSRTKDSSTSHSTKKSASSTAASTKAVSSSDAAPEKKEQKKDKDKDKDKVSLLSECKFNWPFSLLESLLKDRYDSLIPQ